MSKIKIEILDDGGIRIDASGAEGSEKEILAELADLAREVGGELKVEAHRGHHHHHHHGHSHGHHKH